MNLQEVDKWLDEEFGVSYTKLEELHDFVLEQGLKKEEKLQKQLETYENMRKELIEYSQDLRLYDNESIEFKISDDLLNILNKVGGSDE
jgi:uncharacterized protein YacL (UPF0231 family)